jgi:glycosyltransferase involved in cell wall biosynthesis
MKMNKINPALTIFTPTYNRATMLPYLYNSLKRQSNKDLKWLIVDDGSSDNTKELVQSWINEDKLDIKYVFQENAGMVAAHNTAHYLIDTFLNVCIDSDDYMTDNAVEKILNMWEQKGGDEYMGIVGLDSYKNGKIIGTMLPDIRACRFSELYAKYKIKGDKKYVLRTDLIKSMLPYPTIKNEKFPAPSYLYLKLEEKYNFLILNEVLCVVEYLPDGNSMNKIKQYKQSPNAFAVYRKAKMEYALTYKDRFRNAIHYVSSLLLAKKYDFFIENPYKLTTFFAIPMGFLLYLYINNTERNSVSKNLNKK